MSTPGKTFGIRTQKDSKGRFLAKVVVNDKDQKPFIVVAEAGAAAPSAHDVITALKTDYGFDKEQSKTDKKGRGK